MIVDKLKKLSLEYLKSRVCYDPDTGVFTWLVPPNGYDAGDIAGKPYTNHNKKTDIRITLGGETYLAHRLAWYYTTEKPPEDQVDHINGRNTDNRWINLREVSDLENKRNKRLYATNKSGLPGVWWNAKSRKWMAMIHVGGKRTILAYTDDFFEAVCARRRAEIQYGFHPNHGTDRPL